MNTETKRHIDSARQVLVGVVPNPTSQIDQITYALIYKFMDDMDQVAIKNGDEPAFFVDDLEQYSWARLMDTKIGNQERMNMYVMAFQKFSEAKQLPILFRNILKSAFLPYRSPEVLGLFLKEINYFDYSHPEELGNAYEYLLSIMSSQGDAGQFRTPRHIIDFIVDVIDPTENDKVLDPACGTGGFLVSSYKHILEKHDGKNDPEKKEKSLTPDQRKNIMNNFEGYDIDPTMVRIAQVNMYLHQFKDPKIYSYDTLSMDERWNDKFDVIMANPPFMSPKGGSKPHSKFSIQSSRSEVLFVDYIVNHLRPKGRAGIIVPEGIIFQSGIAYKQLRKNLVENGLYAVVSLPSGVFNPYAGVKTSILLIDNDLAKQKDEILFVKIQNDGFDLGAQRRQIEKNDLLQALEILNKYKSFCDIENDAKQSLSLIMHKSKIAETGDYNLSGDRYRIATDYTNAKWPMVELGKVCELHRGVVYSKPDEVSSNGYKILRANNITLDDKLLLDDVKLISKDLKLKESQKLEAGDIFICLASGGKEHVGKVAYINENTEYYFGGFMGAIRITNEAIRPLYLFHLLKDQKFNDFLGREISGANINNLNFGILSHYQIPLPPLEIQEQIVVELEGYQKIIDGAKQIVKNWKPKIEIDPEWSKYPLKDLVIFENGKAHEEYISENGKYLVINSKFIASSGSVKKYTNSLLKPLSTGDVVMVMSDVPNGKALAKCFFVRENNKYTLNQRIGLFRPRNLDTLDNTFLYLQLNRNQYLLNFDNHQSQTNLRMNTILECPFYLPTLKVQKQIVEKIEVEQALVESAKKLIEIYEQKTKETINNLWSEG